MSLRILWTHNFPPDNPNSLVFISAAAATLRIRGIDVQLDYLGNLRSPAGLLAARRHVALESRHFDIVHAQYGSACAVASSAAAVPKILSVRGNDWNLHSDALDFHYAHTRLARAMTRWAATRFDRVVTVSRRLTGELRRFARQVETLPSPIDLDRFRPRHRVEARRALGSDDTRCWVLFNSQRLEDPIKRYPLARAAFDIANQRCGGALVLRVINALPHHRLPLEVSACDAVLCTSETEGWPNSIKEALACNVPFVSTDVSDLRDIAGQEPACRICPPDPAAIAEQLLDVLSLPRPETLRRHVAGMSLAATTERLEAIYRETVSASRTAA